MSDTSTEQFVARRDALIARLAEVARDDDRIAALWLQGSLADGTSDPLSDVDAYLAIQDDAYDELYGGRVAFAEALAAIHAQAETPAMRALHLLMEGPVKLDLFFDRLSDAPERERPAVRMLVDKVGLGPRLRTGWQPSAEAAARTVETLIRGTRQGAMWPVRLARRGQWSTLVMSELELINEYIALFMAVQLDPRLAFKNRLSFPRLLRPEQRRELDDLTDATLAAFTTREPAALLAAHLCINNALVREGRAACAALGIPYPGIAEGDAAIRAFYEREWPGVGDGTVEG